MLLFIVRWVSPTMDTYRCKKARYILYWWVEPTLQLKRLDAINRDSTLCGSIQTHLQKLNLCIHKHPYQLLCLQYGYYHLDQWFLLPGNYHHYL